jgi:hypothetical protein
LASQNRGQKLLSRPKPEWLQDRTQKGMSSRSAFHNIRSANVPCRRESDLS